MMFISW